MVTSGARAGIGLTPWRSWASQLSTTTRPASPGKTVARLTNGAGCEPMSLGPTVHTTKESVAKAAMPARVTLSSSFCLPVAVAMMSLPAPRTKTDASSASGRPPSHTA